MGTEMVLVPLLVLQPTLMLMQVFVFDPMVAQVVVLVPVGPDFEQVLAEELTPWRLILRRHSGLTCC